MEKGLSFDVYPPEAFAFVAESLAAAVEDAHGPATRSHAILDNIMRANGLTPSGLAELYRTGELNPAIRGLVEDIGGPESIDRHISGKDLCRTLRRLSVERWGLLARTVLSSWNITRTLDFGNIVFEMVEKGRLAKRPEDSLDDFDGVYSFDDFDDVPVGGET